MMRERRVGYCFLISLEETREFSRRKEFSTLRCGALCMFNVDYSRKTAATIDAPVENNPVTSGWEPWPLSGNPKISCIMQLILRNQSITSGGSTSSQNLQNSVFKRY